MARRRLDDAFQAVGPMVLVHGHYHVQDQTRVKAQGWEHETLVVSIGCDEMIESNLAVLHLPHKASAGSDATGVKMPTVRWVPLPPVTTVVDPSRLGIWPEKPVWAWETEDFQRVFDEGRSAHWSQLIVEAAAEPEGAGCIGWQKHSGSRGTREPGRSWSPGPLACYPVSKGTRAVSDAAGLGRHEP